MKITVINIPYKRESLFKAGGCGSIIVAYVALIWTGWISNHDLWLLRVRTHQWCSPIHYRGYKVYVENRSVKPGAVTNTCKVTLYNSMFNTLFHMTHEKFIRLAIIVYRVKHFRSQKRDNFDTTSSVFNTLFWSHPHLEPLEEAFMDVTVSL